MRDPAGRCLTNKNGWNWVRYRFILDVHPDGAPAFRTEVTKPFASYHHSTAGDTVRVRCNPDRHAAQIDVSEDERFNRDLYGPADKQRRKDEREQMLHAAPGTPTPDGEVLRRQDR